MPEHFSSFTTTSANFARLARKFTPMNNKLFINGLKNPTILVDIAQLAID
jgi:hypothetical protein